MTVYGSVRPRGCASLEGSKRDFGMLEVRNEDKHMYFMQVKQVERGVRS